ncbi:MAG: hypothetical protein AB9888_13015 [Bacteroidales bacterium]
MSCDRYRRKMFSVTANALLKNQENATPIKINGRMVIPTTGNLDRWFETSRNAVDTKNIPPEILSKMREDTVKFMRLFDTAGLQRPTHSNKTKSLDGRLPKQDSWPGYSALYALIDSNPVVRADILFELAKVRMQREDYPPVKAIPKNILMAYQGLVNSISEGVFSEESITLGFSVNEIAVAKKETADLCQQAKRAISQANSNDAEISLPALFVRTITQSLNQNIRKAIYSINPNAFPQDLPSPPPSTLEKKQVGGAFKEGIHRDLGNFGIEMDNGINAAIDTAIDITAQSAYFVRTACKVVGLFYSPAGVFANMVDDVSAYLVASNKRLANLNLTPSEQLMCSAADLVALQFSLGVKAVAVITQTPGLKGKIGKQLLGLASFQQIHNTILPEMDIR